MAADKARPRVTIRTVAAHAGVSRQTVSNALNAPERMTPATLAKVQASIEELNYRPDEAARALTSGRTRLIGIRVGQTAHNSAANPDPLLRAIVSSAARYGYRIIIFEAGSSDDEEIASFEDLLRGGAVDGILISDTHVNDARAGWLRAHDVPFAAFGAPWGQSDETHPWIDVDGAAGMHSVVSHLVELGRTRIAFLGWPSDGAGGDDRHRGWVDAMESFQLDPDLQVRATEDSIEAGKRASTELLARFRPDAIVCASDLLAAGACQGVGDAGLLPGRDVSVTGYDDSPVAILSQPQLTTLRQPLSVVADFLVDHIVLAGEPDISLPPSGMVAPELVIRASSGG